MPLTSMVVMVIMICTYEMNSNHSPTLWLLLESYLMKIYISAKYFSYIGFLIFKIDVLVLRPLTDLLGSLIAGHER